MAKKEQRRGNTGGGGSGGNNIEQDQFDYLIRVLERWRDPFEVDDERKIFVRNVFQQMEGEERTFCGNQLASRVIELLLPYADVSVVQKFTEALSEDLRKNCVDQFCSHVLEKIMVLCCFKPIDNENTLFQPWIVKMCRFLCNNFAEFSGNVYASHLIRTCIECITGTRIQEKQKQNQTEGYDQMDTYQFKGNAEIIECQEILEEKIRQSDTDTLYNELSSVVIQYYLKAMKAARKKDRLKPVVKFLVETIYLQPLDYIEDQSSVRLLESILEACSILPKIFETLNSQLFAGKLVELSTHQQANYLVQRYFDNVPSSEMFGSAYSEIAEHLEQLIGQGFTGVVLSVVKACVRLKSQQTAVLKDLGKALHCNQTLDELTLACIMMTPADKINKEEMKISLHGSLLFQELLDLNKPIQVVRSLLNLDAVTLRKIFSDRSGAHIINRFVASSAVGEKSRESLVKQLRGEYVSLSCSKQGSWAVQKLWDTISMKHRQMIVEELVKQENVLRNDQFGKFVHRSCAVSVFAHQRSEWNQTITKSEREKNMFEEIIGDVKPEKTKKDSFIDSTNKDSNKEPDEVGESIETVATAEEEPPKKKKKKAKSYLDEL